MKKLLALSVMLIITLSSYSLKAQGSWTLQTNPLGIGDSAIIGKVQFVSPTEGWISGGNGDLLHTTDAGTNWIVVTPFPDDTVWSSSDPAVSMSWVNSTHGWKINSFGPEYGISYGVVVHQTTNGGNTWEKKVLSTTEGDFGFQIQFVDINTGWLLYFNFSTQVATFLRTTDGGNIWNPFTGGGIFYFVDSNNGWSFYGSGQNGSDPPFKILRTTNGGTDWSEQFTDNTVGGYNAMYFSDLEHGWIVGDVGKVLNTTNGGTNWNYVTNSGINSSERSKAVFFLDANNGWISSKDISNHAFIRHTSDGGASWTTQGTYPIYGSIYSIYFYDVQNGWVTGFDPPSIYHFTGTTSVEENNNIPIEFSLAQNYPNPFNPNTTISYQIKEQGLVQLKVFNLLGQEVAILVNEMKAEGSYSITFDANKLSSGVYIYSISVNDFVQNRKMTLLK